MHEPQCIKGVVNIGDQGKVDPLIECILAVKNLFFLVIGERKEIINIIRGSFFQRKARIIHREKIGCAGEQVKLIEPVGLLEDIVKYFCSTLTGTEDGYLSFS